MTDQESGHAATDAAAVAAAGRRGQDAAARAGVDFPVSADGRRSTSALGRAAISMRCAGRIRLAHSVPSRRRTGGPAT